MMKTEIAKLLKKELHISLQEAFWLVSCLIRDEMLIGIDWKPKGKRRGKRWKNILWYIALETSESIKRKEEEKIKMINEKYGLTEEDWLEPLV